MLNHKPAAAPPVPSPYQAQYPLLHRIDGPQDLKGLSRPELLRLADELRGFILDVVCNETGGHLASNLGAVELAIALHRVFNSPQDKIIWDTGHQAYPHKLLTGRRDRFGTLRRFKGLRGFPHPSESEHDMLAVGHAGTSIAAAMGYAHARANRGTGEEIIAVIGDGAMTSGLALEALNNAAMVKGRLIVILNDNQMSISPNVGSLTSYLSSIRSNTTVRGVKAAFLKGARKVPVVGRALARLVKLVRESVFYLMAPAKSGAMFEEWGFTYLGPYDGHNLLQLIDLLESVKQAPATGPVLIHLLTRKGKGHGPSEADAVKWHGVSPGALNPPPVPTTTDKVEPPKKVKQWTDIFTEALIELAAQDPRILAITAAMDEGTGLKHFRKHYPDRCFDVGIAEQFAVTCAAGQALGGMRPVVAIYSTFMQRAYDQIIHDVCLQKPGGLPVLFALDRAGLVGADGETHQGAFDLAYLRSIPNMVVMAPKDDKELRDMLYTGLQHDGPAAVRYPRGKTPGAAYSPGQFDLIPLGKGEVLRTGGDVAILAIGAMVPLAQQAAEKLKEQGVEAMVINARFVKPLDEELVMKAALRCGGILTMEEHVRMGGFGSAVLECLQDRELIEVPVRRMGLPDQFVEHGETGEIRPEIGLTVEAAVQHCLEL
ncbi:MAG TPA: 1-deoxy-D-xylulose-5-phosphate synthase, partial [bacterium]|nr:1-deoxy-D-xylulose-5-phosphate synthase [bacterium]